MDGLARAVTKLESSSERVCLNLEGTVVEELGALEERIVRVVSNLRFVLNSARSPVNKLPPELLLRIFAHLHTPRTSSRHHPLERVWKISKKSLATVNLVCRYWCQTVIGVKQLRALITTTAAPEFECRLERDDKAPRAGREKQTHNPDPNQEPKKWPKKVTGGDFETVRALGEGCAGRVLLVRLKDTSDLFALKAVTKKHALAKQELQHALTEQAVLKRMTTEGGSPFIVKLWWSFHDHDHLFLAMDFLPGGDLATHLARWGRLGRDRTRLYAAEIVEGVESLHKNGIVYRDLQPENVLIGSDGHIVLTDFGLSKELPRGQNPEKDPQNQFPSTGTETTNTFCGTAEYIAPEVIQGLPYSFEVDWWSFGTMLYEMLTGVTPFWANNHLDMYSRVLHDKLQFPEDRTMDQDTKSLIRSLLRRNPSLRIKEPRIKRHPYFSTIDWKRVYYKRYIAPYIPPIDPSNASDVPNLDETLLEDMEPVVRDGEGGEDRTDSDQDQHTDTDGTEGEDPFVTTPQSRSPSVRAQETEVDTFDPFDLDAYLPKRRHSHSAGIDDSGESSGLGYEEDEEEGGSILRSPTFEDITDQKPFSAEVPDPSVDSQRSETPVEPHIPPESSTVPRSSKYSGKRREMTGIAARNKHPGDSSDDGWDLAPVGVDEDRNGQGGTSLFARRAAERYRLSASRRSTSVRRGNRTVSGMPKASGTEDVPRSPSEKQTRGRTPFSFWNKKNALKPPPTSSPASDKRITVTHSSSTGWREREKSGFVGKTAESMRGPRPARARDRDRGSRSDSISEDHTSEGHQSPEDDGESKKKVDWYDV